MCNSVEPDNICREQCAAASAKDPATLRVAARLRLRAACIETALFLFFLFLLTWQSPPVRVGRPRRMHCPPPPSDMMIEEKAPHHISHSPYIYKYNTYISVYISAACIATRGRPCSVRVVWPWVHALCSANSHTFVRQHQDWRRRPLGQRPAWGAVDMCVCAARTGTEGIGPAVFRRRFSNLPGRP